MSLQSNLVKYMKLRNITIKELSNKTDISEATLKRLRTFDSVNPTLDILIKITNALNIKINELVSDDGLLKEYILGDHTDNQEITDDKFIIIFQQEVFSFKAGTKAIFKKFTAGNPITKYVMNNKLEIMKLIDSTNYIFMDTHNNILSLREENIFAHIIKQLYEVSYV